MSTLKMLQKYIRVANCLDYGWGAVCHYQADPLADDSNDKKQLHRANKETKKDFEEGNSYSQKKLRGGNWDGRRGRQFNPYNYRQCYDSWDSPGPSRRREVVPSPIKPLMFLAPQRQIKHIWPRPLAVRVLYSNASSTGYGRYVIEHGNC